MNIEIFGEAEEQTIQQMENCLAVEEGSLGVLCADSHLGYSQPIGGAVAYRDYISPSGVGYDIGCGNKAVMTNLFWPDIDNISNIMNEITRRISFGMGQDAKEETKDHEVFDAIAHAEFPEQRDMLDLARKQLGTVGSGNHYVDLFKDETDHIWIGVHFGSRGFGHKTASGFMALSQGLEFTDHPKGGEMNSPPIVFHTQSMLGYNYIMAMNLAGDYAYAGRDIVCEKVLDILGAESVYEIHNHHNFAWREEHFGESFWVIRKGCTPANAGQEGFVGATMGEQSVILEGISGPESERALRSTVHGAGRVLTRTQAKGKIKRRKFWECNDRDCDYSTTDFSSFNCPNHPNSKPQKRFWEEKIREGLVDFGRVKDDLINKGIELRGGDADEAPEAYKRLPDVLMAHNGSIKINQILTPVGVAMAGANTHDLYKD